MTLPSIATTNATQNSSDKEYPLSTVLALIGVIVSLIVILPLLTLYFQKRCAEGRQLQPNIQSSDWKDVAFDKTVSKLPPLREFSTTGRNLEPKPGLFLPSIQRPEIKIFEELAPVDEVLSQHEDVEQSKMQFVTP